MDRKLWILVAVLILVGIRFFWLSTNTHPVAYEIQNFPLIAQPDNVTCGPTSTTMVLNYYGVQTNVDAVAKIALTRWHVNKDGTAFGGTSPEFIAVALNKLGVKSKVERDVSLDKLKYYVSQGRPVIVLVRSDTAMWHYIVAIGYDSGNIITADPGGGQRIVLPNKNFMGAWKFTTDLDGNDKSVKCPICKGQGNWCWWLGPLGICDVCGGTGKIPDIHDFLMEMGEAKGQTIILPLMPK